MSRSATYNEALIPSTPAIYGLPAWYPKAFGWLAATTFALIALGGSVRIMNAGLACPDWPLCFGDFIPDYHPQVYFEFLHRVLAGLVAIATFSLQFILLKSAAPRSLKWLAVASMVLLLTQVVFGGLTVLLQLHSKVVAAHLGMGTGFFALLMWMYLSLQPRESTLGAKSDATESLHVKSDSSAKQIPASLKRWSIFLGLALYGQIILGGLVASHFASLACTDFPTCNGAWFPTFSGVIGLHVIHRLGAYTLFALVLINLIVIRKKIRIPRLNSLSTGIFAMVLVQIGIGVANVLFFTPPLIAVLHLATATAILGLLVKQIHFVTR